MVFWCLTSVLFCLQVIKLNSLIDAGDLEGVSNLLSQNVGLNPWK